MVGGIIIAVVLVVVFPVVFLISMGILAAMISSAANQTFNAQHKGGELFDVAHTNFQD